jgi:hypothetical protein
MTTTHMRSAMVEAAEAARKRAATQGIVEDEISASRWLQCFSLLTALIRLLDRVTQMKKNKQRNRERGNFSLMSQQKPAKMAWRFHVEDLPASPALSFPTITLPTPTMPRARIKQDHRLTVVLSYDLRPNHVPRESHPGKMSVKRSRLGSEVTHNQQVKEDRRPIKIAAEAVSQMQ